MHILIEPNGNVRCIYGETIELAKLGALSITRGSHVEPNSQGQWLCDLSPVGGPVLRPFTSRSEALDAETAWLLEHWLMPVS